MATTTTGTSTEATSNLMAAAAPVNETKVTAITSTGTGPLGIGSAITFTLTTDHAVTVTGTPRLTLSNGAHAVFAGIDGSGRPTFTYTVAQGDTATSHLAVTGLDTTGGTINGPQAQMSFALQPYIVVDSRPDSVALADVNGDNRLDLLAVHSGNDYVSVRLGNGDGSFSGEMRLEVGGSPVAIKIADVNSDGKIDVIAVNSDDNDISVLLGKGDGTFANKVDFGTGTYPRAVTVADVNGDKKLDLIVANGISDNLSVLLGNGDGSFSSKTDYAAGNSPTSTAAADLNGDGKLDLVALNGSGGSLSILHGKGDGTFVNATDVAVGRGLGSVIAVDLEGDGDIDLVTANSYDNTVSIRLNNGSGSFAQAGNIPVAQGSVSVVAADINGDGKLDLVTGNGGNGNLSVLLGRGDGTFSSNMPISAGVPASSITAADVNGDGRLDLIAASSGSVRFAVLLNTSTPTLSFDLESIADAAGADTGRAVDATRPDRPIVSLLHDTGFSDSDLITNNAALSVIGEDGATFSYDFGPPQTAAGNYNPDAIADGTHTVSVIQWDKAGNSSYSTGITFTLDRKAPDAPIVTLTADTGASSTDKVTSNGALTIGGVERGATLRYIIDGTPSDTYDPATLADGQHTVEVIQTDRAGNVSAAREITFELDRTPEVTKVTSITSDGSGTLKIGDSITFTLTTSHIVTVTGTPKLVLSNGAYAVFSGMDSSGYPKFTYTVAAGHADTADLTVTGLDTASGTISGPVGALGLGAQSIVPVDRFPQDIATADINGDGILDMVVANSSRDFMSVRLGDGNGGFSNGSDVAAFLNPRALSLADINGDGKVDLVTATAGGLVSVVFGDGAGSFADRKVYLAGQFGDSVATADMNNDGHLDILVGNYSDDTVSVRLADGAGGFLKQTVVKTNGTPDDIAIGDVNGDGKLDLLVANFDGGDVSVLLGNGAGGFSTQSPVTLSDGVNALTLADINDDGDLDLLVTNYFTDTVSVFLGDGAGTFDKKGDVAVSRNPNALAVADINGDGKLDLATANGGSGTVSVLLGDGLGGFSGKTDFGVGARPSAISIADVNGDGKLDVMVTNYNDNTVSVLLNTSTTGLSFDATSLAGATGADTGRTVDATRPDAPVVALISDTGLSGSDLITSNGALDIGGREAGATLSYVIDGGTPTDTYDPAALDDGKHTVVITQTDEAGNVSDPVSITFRLDRAVSAPIVTLAADTGASSNDKVTSHGALEIGGIEAGAKLTYIIDGGTPTDTYDPTTLDDGEHTVQVIQTDKAGNVSAAGSIAFTLDSSLDTISVVSITSDGDSTLGIGDTITFTLTMSKTVSVTGTPALTLSNGAKAVYAGLDSSGNPTFSYTVVEGDTDTAGLDVTGLDTASGTIDGLPATFGLAPQTTTAVGSRPVSVATGDFNGDGILDLVATSYNSSSVSVRFGDGAGNFSGTTQVGVGRHPYGIVVADVNGDGKLDILTTNETTVTVSVLLGDGTGSFTSMPTVFANSGPRGLALADINGDGNLDMLVANRHSNTVSVRLGDGTGRFSGTTEINVGELPLSVVATDLNGDGKLDLLSANAIGTVSVRMGDGKGNFSGTSEVGVSNNGYTSMVALADFNADGKIDFVTSNYGSGSVSVRLGDGHGGFSGSGEIGIGGLHPLSVAVGDINGDGHIDIVTGNDGLDGQGGSISVLLGKGDGTFAASLDFVAGRGQGGVTLADVNGDGKLDILRTSDDDDIVSVFLNSSTSTLSFDATSIADATGAETGHAVDATRPDKPVVSLLSDTGISGSDGITSNAALSVTGEDGATFSYQMEYQTAWGDYDPDAIADGAHTVRVMQTDEAGNQSDVTTITFTLDRKVPDAPTVTLAADTGASGSDRITRNAVLDIGGLEQGATLSYIIDGGVASNTYDPAALADGDHTIKVMQTDKAGNLSAAAIITFTLDRSVAAPVVALTQDTGTAGDNITTHAALTLTGIEQGATLSYVVDGGIASANYDPAALSLGAHTVSVTQTDLAGNVSDAGSITFTLEKPYVPPVPGNAAPIVANDLDNQAVTAGSQKTFTFAADAFTDADGDALTYSIANLPSWLSFDAITRTFTAAPSATDLGIFSVAVTASDGRGGSVTDMFDIVVSSPTSGVEAIDLSNKAVKENAAGGTVVGQLTALDTTENFEFTLARNPKGAFDIVDGNLVVADGAHLDFETRDHYRIRVVGTDESGNRISQAFTISITDVAELIKGTRKSDVLVGDKGADIIKGLRSDDVLKGRGGDDRLHGGAGADTFVFGPGHDIVRDFHDDQNDVIDLSHAHGILGFRDLKANHVEETDGGLVITDDNGSTMTLRHVELADLRADNFHF